MAPPVRLGVIGAGINGLTVATLLQDTQPQLDITIVTEKISPNTTTDVAAGLWMPYILADNPPELTRRWGGATYKYLRELYKSENCRDAGVTQVSGYVFKEGPDADQDPYWKDMVETFKVLTPENLKSYPPYQSGIYLTTFTVETTIYMQWLLSRFQANLGKMHRKKVHSIEEICEDFDIIIDCSGLGAVQLLQDKELQPVKGHVIRVRAPWMKSFYFFGRTNYIIPTTNEVILGGTQQVGNWDLQCSQKDKDSILHEVYKFMPNMKKAEYIRDDVGLRPVRKKVRLERKDIPYKSKMIPVIHNYGHGGSGIALHWGCALDVIQLVTEAVKDIQMKAKL